MASITREAPQSASLATLYVPAGGGPFADLGDHSAHIKVSAQTSGGGFLFTEIACDYKGGVPPHIHHKEDETFYILEGRFVFMVGEDTVEVGPGDTVFGPRGVRHAWNCLSENGGKLLIMFTPGDNFEAFAIGMAVNNFNPKAEMSGEGAARFTEFAAQHGIEMLQGVSL